METVDHAWLVDLVNENVELKLASHSVNFHLSAPGSFPCHLLTVGINWVLVILILRIAPNKRFELIWVIFYERDSCFSVCSLLCIVPVQLISHSTEQAISIASDFTDNQTNLAEFLFKQLQILLDLYPIECAYLLIFLLLTARGSTFKL